ncbi:MAG: hypothetical protein IPM80_15130 [Proteobacteria bacterium]|nr:hypothetical protein [Pseudomonadota bacterium]
MARGYLYGILDSNWSWRVDFEHEDIEMDLVLFAPGDFQALETERLKIAAAYHGPSGVGASLVPMFIRQRAELPQSCPNAKCAFRADTESFIFAG